MECDSIFDGKYRVIKVLGKGGMSTVYLAENIKLGTMWAIKEINKRSNSNVNIRVEPDILKKLNHPCLPRIFDIIEDEENIYTIVDYIEGTPLDKEILKFGKFPEDKVIDWAKQICDVLQYLHSFKPNPIIYRDMKPSNIILTPEGKIKLIDFGIAREYKQGSDSDTIYIGTKGYAAPEQYGNGQSNVATDIYGLGVTLYHLITGKSPNEPPYEIKPVRQLNSGLSEEIEMILLRCTRSDPEERYQSIIELMQDFNSIGSNRTQPLGIRLKQENESAGVCTSFKRLVLTVWGNSEFAGELGYVAAKACGLKVLILDLDFFSSGIDITLDIKQSLRNNGKADDTIQQDDELKSGQYSKVIENKCVRISGLNNLFLLKVGNSIEEFHSHKDMNIEKLIETAYRSYDVTILTVSRLPEDPFAIAALKFSDFNIIAAPANIPCIREFERYLGYMERCHGISPDKVRFTAWEYKKELHLPVSILRKVYSGNAFIGTISYDDEREKGRNMKDFIYPNAEYQRLIGEYRSILASFDIIPRATAKERLKCFAEQVGSRILEKRIIKRGE